ncbi:MobC family plasmid mobilization relaxosome protein [Acetobacter orleanensis]|uniref:MobC family plasmid mobilization relaxosome protein n=1 Tax=Acetobacter orleanensis TaxID=104099 RepID=UPI00211B8525|nr:MobC family plasmid mobilization relaxosome protein [Acetobacter orleanensis]
MRHALSRIGNNLNQLAHSAHCDDHKLPLTILTHKAASSGCLRCIHGLPVP